MPTIRLFGSNSMIRSTSSSGNRCGRIRSIGGISINRVTLAVGTEHVVPERARNSVSAFRRGIVMLHVIGAQEFHRPRLHAPAMNQIMREVVQHVADRNARTDPVD